MKIIALTLLSIFLGLGLMIFLPLVYAIWLRGWFEDTLAYWTGAPHVCDAGDEAAPSPTVYVELDGTCRHGVTPADNCLMCAIEAPDDEPDIEQPFDVVRVLRDAQAEADKQAARKDEPLPDVFLRWIEEYKRRK